MEISATLIEGSPDGVFAFDRECRYTLWNPAMERISGMKAAEVLGRRAPDVFPFLAETGEMAHFESVLGGAPSVSRERRFRLAEMGGWGFYDTHYFPVREGGDVAGGAAIMRNVTGRWRNRMRSSAQVRVSQILAGTEGHDAPALILAAIGETTRWDCGAFWEADESGRGLECHMGWRVGTVSLAPFAGLARRCWETLEAAWIEDSPAETLRSAVAIPIRAGGKAIGVMAFFSHARADRDPEMLALLEDLGAQFGQFVRLIGAQAVRKQQVDEVRTLLDTLPVGVLIAHDAHCTRVTGNRIGNRLMRMEADANISKTPRGGAPAPPYRAYREGVELPLDELPLRRALAGKPVDNLEYQLAFPDGARIDLLISAAPLLDEDGHVRGAVATLLDVTEQKRAQRALREEDRRKTEFIATLAHELRNPLAPILNAVKIMQLRKAAAPELAGVQDIIERQLRHMVRLVDDLLDVSRITRGRLEMRRERVTLDALVTQALEAARPGIEREGHALEVKSSGGNPWINGDVVRLVQALVNLLTNASKYTPSGGRICVHAFVEGEEAVVRVADNGIGMTFEQLARAFDMFWQAGDAVGRSQGGLGIGLSLARRIVELHGGKLQATSEGLGYGSEFTMRLPVAISSGLSPEAPSSSQAPARAS